ncbi:MAG: sodium-translocating pyrophosphatase [Phycisphaerae bacterium]|nr:sodium-translocating pyrophosphatase [Phycisphaerae bacterium]
MRNSVSLTWTVIAATLLLIPSVISAQTATTQPADAGVTQAAEKAENASPPVKVESAPPAALDEGETPSLETQPSTLPPLLWWIAPIGSVLALIFAWIFFKQVKAADPGDENMQRIAGYVRRGAYAYLKRQYMVVAVFFVIVCAALYWMGQVGLQHKIVFIAFLTGGFFSGLCGFLGMKTATLASNRAAQGAKESLNRGLVVAFRAGAVMGLVVVGFGLLDITAWFLILTQLLPKLIPGFEMGLVEVTVVMLTFGMGASSQALFARVGGGIYTKAADVGADLVGKVEAGIPEDDPRNPATIADNVGDNVGDVAGMGADLYESYCGSILATAALGVAAAFGLGADVKGQLAMLAAPMVLAGVGILLSILGIYMVRTKEGASMKQLMRALMRGVVGSSLLIVAAALGVCWLLLGDVPGVSWLGVWLAIVVGLAAGLLIGYATEYYTSYDYKPTKEVADNAETGPATVIISGLATGMKSTWFSLLVVIAAIIAAYSFAGGADSMLMGLYGVGIAAVGMLATLGITLATDAYGPIADNAGGNAEMTHQPPEVRKRTDALDSLGNTTAAMGKGFAIGSAALTALALLAAYVEEVRIGQVREGQTAVVQHCGQDVIVGQAAHCGAKKVAVVKDVRSDDDGNAVIEAETYMVLTNLPKDFGAGEIELAWSTEPNDDNVRKADLTHATALGENGEALRISGALLVPAKQATLRQFMDFYGVNLMNPKVLCGVFAGVLLVFLFSAMTMKAVGRAAMSMVKEVRRQFKEIPGIMEGKGEPDYARCVSISTAGAQKAMIIPSSLALVVPILVGLVLDVGGVLGLLAGGLTCGFAMAIFMANAGGAWDNAKKYIETGAHGGKGSDAHKAAVVGDTVGDPFKDTSGPSLNILIKLMSMVSVVFAGLVVKYAPLIGAWIGLD